jgi:pimeloyl-ACP methyl ester carboxylesterase
VAALDRTLARVDGPVIVGGHAYVGAVIAGTRSERVKGLVYVTALAPDEGETVADVFYHAKPDPRRRNSRQIDADLSRFRTTLSLRPSPNATADERLVLAAVQRPLTAGCISGPLLKDRPSWFVVAEQDRMILRETQLFMADRMNARLRTISSDHTPIISLPGANVDFIVEAVRKNAETGGG